MFDSTSVDQGENDMIYHSSLLILRAQQIGDHVDSDYTLSTNHGKEKSIYRLTITFRKLGEIAGSNDYHK